VKHRKLRIVWSVGWGLVGVLLIAIWAHGYFCWDMFFVRSGPGGFQFTSAYGRLICIRYWHYTPDYVGLKTFTYRPEWMDGWPKINWRGQSAWEWSPGWWSGTDKKYANSSIFSAPIWFPTLLAALFTASPQNRLRPRYSLRTLLIATTLVAVGLGLIVWLR
jgi:hypothetical protein